MIEIIFSPVVMIAIGLISGFAYGVYLCDLEIKRYKDLYRKEVLRHSSPPKINSDFYDESMNDYNSYYVRLPNSSEPIEIEIEESLNVNHEVILDGVNYVVESVIHKPDRHTVFQLKLKYDSLPTILEN